MTKKPLLPTDPEERKKYPIYSGVIEYFPSALLEVAKVSYMGNVQHNGPNTPLQWTRGKSTDQADTTLRHSMEGEVRNDEDELILNQDTDGTYHLAKAAWRILARLQVALEREGAPLAPRAVLSKEEKK